MAKKVQKKKKAGAKPAVPQVKDYLDMTAPSVVKFNSDHAVIGGAYHAFMAIRSYPATTEEPALLSHLGAEKGVNIQIIVRQVTAAEERQIIQNASNKSRFSRSNTNDLQQSVAAENDLHDVTALITQMHREREPLDHCAVFPDLIAPSLDELRSLKDRVMAGLVRAKLGVDPLLLRQREGFLCANLAGFNAFGAQFERVLPASSVANLYPSNYCGKTDPHGFFIGQDKCGSNIIVDLDRRAEDKTNANVLVLGNSGQGKSYLMKLLLTNIRLSGKTVLCLDPEHELVDLCGRLGGCFVDLMGGRYRINPLEPRLWADDAEDDPEAPATFQQGSRLSQHISFLKDFFRAYKDFTDRHVDAIELMLERLYAKFGLDNATDFSRLRPVDYPILSDLYAVIEDAYQNYGAEEHPLYPKALLQEILLGLHSMCRGAESKFFNGQTNITSAEFLVFGCKGLTDAAASVRNALLFNVLSYFSHRLLTEGNAVASIDELHLFLSNPTTVEYIRGFMKRVRKKDSAVMLASQNLEDFNLPGIAELTRPLFSIPTHQFLFNAGSIDPRFFMDNLQLERSEYEIVKNAQAHHCLFKCGAERFHLEVIAPPHKAKLFGTAGGK